MGVVGTLPNITAQDAPIAPEPPTAPESTAPPVAPKSPKPIIEAVENVASREKKAAEIQEEINSIADTTVDLESQYKTVLRELETVNAYNAQMKRVVSSQEEEIAVLESDLANLQNTQRQIIPLLLKMIEALDQFVEKDTPFLAEERTERVEDLATLMDRGDITIAEKFRNISTDLFEFGQVVFPQLLKALFS